MEQLTGDPDRLAKAARQVGLVDVCCTVHSEYLGFINPRDVVAYRLAMPQVAPWVGTLPTAAKLDLFRQAQTMVEPYVADWSAAAVFLSGRVDGQPRRREASRSNAPT